MEKSLERSYIIGMDPVVKGGDKTSLNVINIDNHSGREVFAIYDNKCIAMNVKTDMAHRIYFKKTFGMPTNDYAKLIRGYIKPGKIIFYKTTGFTKVADIPEDILKLVLFKAFEIFGKIEFNLYNTNNGRLELLDYKFALDETSNATNSVYVLRAN